MHIVFNGEPLETTNQATVAALLDQVDLNVNQVAVEVNASIVPRMDHAGHLLHEGDRIEVVTLVGGG